MNDQIAIGLLLVFGQNWLKSQPWFPLIGYETSRANHLFAIAVSGLATIGISVAHSGTWAAGGTVLITIPAGKVLAVGVWHWAQQYAVSKGIYKLLPAASIEGHAAAAGVTLPK